MKTTEERVREIAKKADTIPTITMMYGEGGQFIASCKLRGFVRQGRGSSIGTAVNNLHELIVGPPKPREWKSKALAFEDGTVSVVDPDSIFRPSFTTYERIRVKVIEILDGES